MLFADHILRLQTRIWREIFALSIAIQFIRGTPATDSEANAERRPSVRDEDVKKFAKKAATRQLRVCPDLDHGVGPEVRHHPCCRGEAVIH